MLRVLLTNDDGIGAKGLRALAARLCRRCAVTVVAPARESSAKGHSITLHKPLRIKAIKDYLGRPPGCQGVIAHSVSGTPADAVMLGLLHLYRDNPPDLLISGINNGENVAQDLAYSGTVGAALEGAINGIPSLAVSLESDAEMAYTDAARIVDLLLSLLIYRRVPIDDMSLISNWNEHEQPANTNEQFILPEAVATEDEGIYQTPGRWYPAGLGQAPCLNINLPCVPLARIKGIQWAHPGQREYVDVVSVGHDPRGREYYWIGGERVGSEDDRPGTDTHALKDGYIPITPISYDIGSSTGLAEFKRWFASHATRERPVDSVSQNT